MVPNLAAGQPLFRQRTVHLDLKGLPPTFDRLMSLPGVFAAAGFNAVLVEWEDCFPWTVDVRFRNETAYSPEQVRQFIQTAQEKGLEIIPLVQCLGHMETPLSLPENKHLREVPDRSDVLNVLAPGASELVQRMVDDVLALCPHVRRFHLGGDEAWTIGSHPDTRAYIEHHGKDALYLHHVQPLLKHLADRQIRPILWHDMMIHWSAERLVALSTQADLMVWGYSGHPDRVDPASPYHRRHIERLKECGLGLWCAGAFKGADGADGDLPDFEARRANALAWTDLSRSVDFVGAVATGWSRYNTSDVQVCPLDAALDSLVDLGHIFYSGSPMEGGLEGCAAFLDAIGEGSRFRQCRQAIAHLGSARAAAWKNIVVLRQLQVTARQDCRRRGPSIATRLGYLRQHIAEARAAAESVRQALAGLVPTVWIDRYLDERIVPLVEEFECLDQR